MQIHVWDFKTQKLRYLSKNQIYRPVKHMAVQGANFLMAFEQSDMHLFRLSDANEDLMWLKSGNEMDHDRDVSSVDSLPKKGLYMSGCLDGYVKIWNIKKQIVREVKFLDPVHAVSFLNEEGDILVGHGQKVSLVTHQAYHLKEIKRISNPSDEDVNAFYANNQSHVKSTLFLQLKCQQSQHLKRNFINQPKNAKEEDDAALDEAMLKELEKQEEKQQDKLKQRDRSKTRMKIGGKAVGWENIQDLTLDIDETHEELSSSSSIGSAGEYEVRIREDSEILSQKLGFNDQSQASIVDEQRRRSTSIKMLDEKSPQRQNVLGVEQNESKKPSVQALRLKRTQIQLVKQRTRSQMQASPVPTSSGPNKAAEEKVEDPQDKVYKINMADFRSGSTPAIPHFLTEQNYQKAVGRRLRQTSRNASQYIEEPSKIMTRRDMTLNRIRDSLRSHNQPFNPARHDISASTDQSVIVHSQSMILNERPESILRMGQRTKMAPHTQSQGGLDLAFSSYRIMEQDSIDSQAVDITHQTNIVTDRSTGRGVKQEPALRFPADQPHSQQSTSQQQDDNKTANYILRKFDPNNLVSNIRRIDKNNPNAKHQSEEAPLDEPSKESELTLPPEMKGEAPEITYEKIEPSVKTGDSSRSQRNRFALQMSLDETKLRTAKPFEEHYPQEYKNSSHFKMAQQRELIREHYSIEQGSFRITPFQGIMYPKPSGVTAAALMADSLSTSIYLQQSRQDHGTNVSSRDMILTGDEVDAGINPYQSSQGQSQGVFVSNKMKKKNYSYHLRQSQKYVNIRNLKEQVSSVPSRRGNLLAASHDDSIMSYYTPSKVAPGQHQRESSRDEPALQVIDQEVGHSFHRNILRSLDKRKLAPDESQQKNIKNFMKASIKYFNKQGHHHRNADNSQILISASMNETFHKIQKQTNIPKSENQKQERMNYLNFSYSKLGEQRQLQYAQSQLELGAGAQAQQIYKQGLKGSSVIKLTKLPSVFNKSRRSQQFASALNIMQAPTVTLASNSISDPSKSDFGKSAHQRPGPFLPYKQGSQPSNLDRRQLKGFRALQPLDVASHANDRLLTQASKQIERSTQQSRQQSQTTEGQISEESHGLNAKRHPSGGVSSPTIYGGHGTVAPHPGQIQKPKKPQLHAAAQTKIQ